MEDREAVNGINAGFSEAYDRGDAGAISAFYGDEAALLAPDQPTVRGKRAIEDSFKEGIKELGGKIRIEPVEIVAAGDWAYQWATYTVKGGKKSVAGKFVEVYSRQTNGSWKIRLTIYNTDHPLAGGN